MAGYLRHPASLDADRRKIRLVKSPWLNHSWHTTLYVTSRGLTTSPIPDGRRTFELEFDFTAHRLELRSSDGRREDVPLRAQSVAVFHSLVIAALRRLDIEVRISRKPSELVDPIPFAEDETHRSYDAGTCIDSGERSSRPIVCSRFSGRALSARQARFTSSGVRAIWRSHASRDAEPPSIPVAFPIFRTG